MRNREDLDAGQTRSAKARILVCYQFYFSPNSETQHHMSCYGKNLLYHSQAQYKGIITVIKPRLYSEGKEQRRMSPKA